MALTFIRFRVSKAVQALPIKDEELILTPDIQSDIGAESEIPKRVNVIASLTPAVECQRLQVRIHNPVTFKTKVYSVENIFITAFPKQLSHIDMQYYSAINEGWVNVGPQKCSLLGSFCAVQPLPVHMHTSLIIHFTFYSFANRVGVYF